MSGKYFYNNIKGIQIKLYFDESSNDFLADLWSQESGNYQGLDINTLYNVLFMTEEGQAVLGDTENVLITDCERKFTRKLAVRDFFFSNLTSHFEVTQPEFRKKIYEALK